MGRAAMAVPLVDPWRRESPCASVDHRRFGPMRATLRHGCEMPVWECLDLVPTPRGPADLEFEAGAWGPTVDHERQLDDIVAELDRLSRSAGRVISAETGSLQPVLEWQGATLTGRTGEFCLHFWCTSDEDLLITVSFGQLQPASVRLHD